MKQQSYHRSVFFKPWIGKNYKSGGILKIRTLVLGESHYGGLVDNRFDFTQFVVEKWGIKQRNRFFTSLAKTIIPTADYGWLPDSEREELYESIAFYNYIQKLVGDRPRQRPSELMWKEAIIPFQSVIDSLNPQVVIVLGKELWWYVIQGLDVKKTSDDGRFALVNLQCGSAIVLGNVSHPSSFGYSFKKEQIVVHELLNKVNN
ncbi:MAG: phage hypothetical protein [Bacteroidetes bacterium HLUCCA01]|nr:MAG: phage hypothetical protein [Bacteroidetes bacterium HLUCCA01]